MSSVVCFFPSCRFFDIGLYVTECYVDRFLLCCYYQHCKFFYSPFPRLIDEALTQIEIDRKRETERERERASTEDEINSSLLYVYREVSKPKYRDGE